MKKAFTLIELLIVISIVGLMAILAIPAFNKYGAKIELDAKAEEAKIAIESAYMLAKNPVAPNNGVQVLLNTNAGSNKITVSALKVAEGESKINDCAKGVGCNINEDADRTVAFNSIISMSNCQVNVGPSPLTLGISQIFFRSPGENESIYFSNGADAGAPGSVVVSNTASSISCRISSTNTDDKIKLITINRYPFNVKVEDALWTPPAP